MVSPGARGGRDFPRRRAPAAGRNALAGGSAHSRPNSPAACKAAVGGARADAGIQHASMPHEAPRRPVPRRGRNISEPRSNGRETPGNRVETGGKPQVCRPPARSSPRPRVDDRERRVGARPSRPTRSTVMLRCSIDALAHGRCQQQLSATPANHCALHTDAIRKIATAWRRDCTGHLLFVAAEFRAGVMFTCLR